PLYAVKLDSDAEGLAILPIEELPQRQIGVISNRQSDYFSLAGKEFVSIFKRYIKECTVK
ncbi:MAG: hypothetical protein ACE5PV_17450, partial [Candidatus Poribacteria bacterium]